MQGYSAGHAKGYINGVNQGQNFAKNVIAATLFKSVEPAELMREALKGSSNRKKEVDINK